MGQILIFRVAPKSQSTPLFPEYAHAVPFEAIGVGILEGGTVNGQCSVAVIAARHGDAVVLELTANQVHMIAAALRGAEARFAGVGVD